MNTLQLLHRTREASRILSASRGQLSPAHRQELNQILDAIQFDRQQELNSDPSLWPVGSERRRRVDGLALMHYLKHGTLPNELKGLMKFTAQQTTTTTGGGYTIPETIIQEISNSLKFSGGMWAAARHVITEKGSAFPWPYINDSEKAYKINENTDMETSAQAVAFGAVDLEKAAKYTSGLIRVPNELLEDSDLFVPAFVEALRDRIFRGTNADLTVGTGSGEANGILTAAGYAGTLDSSVTVENIADIVTSVSAFYRNQPGCAFMMHTSTMAHLLKQKSGDNYVFPSIQIDKSLFGFPIIENDDVPAFTVGPKVIAFGDFSRYIIRSTPLRIKRMTERHGDADQTSFACILRVDGDLVDPNAVKYARIAST
jgi:HK97 family phage major capsid protein